MKKPLKSISVIEDVSEAKNFEMALIESEEKYKDLFENAIDPIYINDAEGYILNINRAGIEKLGCTAEEAIGSHVSRWFTPESWKLTRETMRKRIAGEPAEDPMLREIVTKSGEIRWAEIRSRIIKNGDRVVGYQGIARDITEKMEMQQKVKEYQGKLEKSYEQLKKSEAKYRDLFENSTDMLLIGNKDGYILDVNFATVKALGCTAKDEVIGTHFSDWYTPESIELALNNQKRYLSGGPVIQPQILEIVSKDGGRKWVEIISRIIKEYDEIPAIHATARDITEKIKLEQELKKSEAKYRELFENAQDVMCVLDLEGNILKMNRIGFQILGHAMEDVIGTNISRWVTPESLKTVQERQKKRLLGEEVNQIDVLEMVCRNGEHRWVEIKTRDIKEGGMIIEIHGIARDITEKIKLQQELKKSNKQRKILCYLIEGTRGGKTRALILKHLIDRPYNAYQLRNCLNMDYKTIRHHLDILIKNGIVSRYSDGNMSIFFISKNIESELNEFNR